MRYALGTVGVIAAGVLLLVSASMNYTFGFGLGKTPLESYILGAGSVGADVLKALIPFLVLYAIKHRSWMQAAAGVLVWTICTTYSLTSSLGFAAHNRADTMGERTIAATQYSDLRSELKAVNTKLGWIPQHRSVAEVDADINAILDKRIQKGRSRGKTIAQVTANFTNKSWYSRKYGDQVLNLRKELAIAKNAEKLEAEKATLSSKLENTSTKAVTTADPQQAILSQITGLSAEKVRLGLIVLLSLLVEIGSGMGFFVVLGGDKAKAMRIQAKREAKAKVELAAIAEKKIVLDETKPESKVVEPVAEEKVETKITSPTANDNTPSRRPTVPLISSNELKDYYVDRIEMQDGTSITASALYEDYCSWAESRKKEPMTLPAFGRQFGEIGIQKAKIAGRIRYINVKLKSNDVSLEVNNSSNGRLMAASA
ncbi:MAG: hypothetical protein L3J67_07200 [Hyphomicrobiaceae bacterium]|nr:hypothetical protein [Hyphomicrobiaceae bacterium]